MNDIILIDDNSKGQRQSYGASYVDDDTFACVLTHVERLNKDSDLSFLNGAKCVLFHDSLEDWIDGQFDQYSHIAKDNIIEFLEYNKIPYVCFSDGHQSTGIYDEENKNIVKLKKSDFYNRLSFFIEYYIAEREIQFHILAYGKNYLKDLMTIYARALFGKLQTKCPTDIIASYDVMPSAKEEPHYLENIISLSQPAIGLKYDDLLDLIEDRDITVRDFQKHINNILTSVAQNGKNTYTWK